MAPGSFAVGGGDGGEHVTLAAADDGDGISPDNRARIFEPFFTTRRDSGGTGMGLGIVAALVKAHQGTVRLAEPARARASRSSCRRRERSNCHLESMKIRTRAGRVLFGS